MIFIFILPISGSIYTLMFWKSQKPGNQLNVRKCSICEIFVEFHGSLAVFKAISLNEFLSVEENKIYWIHLHVLEKHKIAKIIFSCGSQRFIYTLKGARDG